MMPFDVLTVLSNVEAVSSVEPFATKDFDELSRVSRRHEKMHGPFLPFKGRIKVGMGFAEALLYLKCIIIMK